MHDRLKIIQVVNVRWFNATAWYALCLSRLLKEGGHEVLVLGLSGTDSFKKAQSMGLTPLALPFNTANPVRLASLMSKMTKLVHEFQPDIVNCHRGEGTVLWGLLKKASSTPFALVRTRGDQRPPKASPTNKALHGKLVDMVVATNSRTEEQCRNLLQLPADHLAMIPGGVDTGYFYPDSTARALCRKACGFSRNDFVVGLLGRFDVVKGQKELIEALHKVKKACPEGKHLRLMLMGFPTSITREQIDGWLREYGLEKETVITGKVDDVRGYINAMDLGVIASQGSEAIARAAFEIMACGVPLIGTDVGVMPDLLPGCALVPPGPVEPLVALLEKSATEPAFLEELRTLEKRNMQSFSHQEFLRQTLAVYRQALEKMTARAAH